MTRFIVFLVFLLGATLVPSGGAMAARQAGAEPGWQQTSLTDRVLRLFTPASGAFFAATEHDFLRSDDAGVTWYSVPLGPADTILAVDPTNHRVLYAAGPQGVYQSSDDAASWQQLFSFPSGTTTSALGLAVSPANPNLLYLATATRAGMSSFLRSADAGATWQQLAQRSASLCTWGLYLLEPHPMDAKRVWRTFQCSAGRDFGAALEQSDDAGATWFDAFNAQPISPPQWGYPTRIVGGQGDAPARLYLGVNRDRRLGGSTVLRSDDDGATWNEKLTFRGGGSQGYASPDDDPNAPNVFVGGLAYDPARPDRVYVGLKSFPDYFAPPDKGDVLGTSDGGSTWSELGDYVGGAVNDLALGIDGRNLYAATDTGLWVLPLATTDQGLQRREKDGSDTF